MAARSSRIAVSAAWLAITLLSGAGCRDEHATTGVRLTIRYEEPPALLHIAGTTEDGRFFGPTLLPDPPRTLAPQGETLLLALPDEMDGSVLSLNVTGLNDRRVARMHGFVRTEIVLHTIQSAFVSLVNDANAGRDDGGVSGNDDAGSPLEPIPELDASVADASICDTEACMAPPALPDAGSPPQLEDAATQEPDPPPTPDAEVPCSGTACAIPMQCGTENTCDPKCPGGESCAIACGVVDDCKPNCKNATCAVDCESATQCRPVCEGHGDCEITCRNSDCGEVNCKDDARCLLRCGEVDDDEDRCDLHCAHEMDRKVCAGGVIVCNRECPEGPSEPKETD